MNRNKALIKKFNNEKDAHTKATIGFELLKTLYETGQYAQATEYGEKTLKISKMLKDYQFSMNINTHR